MASYRIIVRQDGPGEFKTELEMDDGEEMKAMTKSDGQPTMRKSPTLADTHLDEQRKIILDRIVVAEPSRRASWRNSKSHSHHGINEDALNPTAAMHSILQHLHLDSDGGLVNISNDRLNGLGEAQQTCKVKAMHRGPLQVIMAAVFVLRVFLNVGKVVHFAGAHALSSFIFEGHASYLGMKYRSVNYANIFGVQNHVADLVIAVSAIEALAMVGFLYAVLRNLIRAACAEGFPRYIGLAKVLWTDVPRLASLSAMNAMSYVHPNLLVKNSKTFLLREGASRAMLDGFFKGRLDKHSNEEVAVQVGKICFSKANLERKKSKQDREELLALASAFIDQNPVKCFKALYQDFGKMDSKAREDLLKEFKVDCSMFDRAWRLTLITLLELCFFGLIVAVMFAVGLAGLLAKLAEGAIVITDGESDSFKIFWFVAFLNQLLSVMAIKELLLWRVETFVFGGCDAVVSLEERYIIRTYRGHLLESIWKSKSFTLTDKISLSLGIDDDDLQQLIVEEDHFAKLKVLTAVKQHMKTGTDGQ